MKDNIQKFCTYCDDILDLAAASLSNSYYYDSLPQCIIDAVFSIGVKYSSTKNTVKNYCNYFGLREYNLKNDNLGDRHTVSQLVANIESVGIEYSTEKIFCNRQRTSTRNGILKSEAVLRYAKILQGYGIETLADIRNDGLPISAEKEILNIPGQKSGLSLHYLYMLSGDSSFAKPDRHVLRFIKNCLNLAPNVDEAQSLLIKATNNLKIKYPDLTVRSLDYAIWNYMSNQSTQPKQKSTKYNKLVRDKIPEIIEACGKTCVTEILNDEDYLRMIDLKLDEELAEYHKDQNIEELADLLEVIRAAAVARGYSLEDLENIRAEKAAKRGVFKNRILLKEVN